MYHFNYQQPQKMKISMKNKHLIIELKESQVFTNHYVWFLIAKDLATHNFNKYTREKEIKEIKLWFCWISRGTPYSLQYFALSLSLFMWFMSSKMIFFKLMCGPIYRIG